MSNLMSEKTADREGGEQQTPVRRPSDEIRLSDMGSRMNLRCTIVNPLDRADWNEDVLSGGGGTFFHTREWAEVLAETYGYKPVYLAFHEGREQVDLLPLMEVKSLLTGCRGVSLPFTDYCGSLSGDGRLISAAMPLIVEQARQSGWKYVELRCGDLPDIQPSTFFYRHTLDLTGGEDAIFARFKSNTRRNVKKGLRHDVEIESASTLDAVKTYYGLHSLTRKRHGLPPQPLSFFTKIYDHVISKKMGFVVLARHEGRYVAGAVFFRFGDKGLYKFGASDLACQGIRPNNLVMWHAIQRLASEGCKELCFGRTEEENQGLRQFKRGWGTEERIVNYYKYDLASDAFVAEASSVKKIHHLLFGKMPVPVLKVLGSILYKHMG